MSQPDLVKSRPGDTPELGHLAPFWAVMLADRDCDEMINMHTYVEEFHMSPPIGSFSNLKFNVKMAVRIPFMTNKEKIEPGTLLVLPYNGGSVEVFTKPPKPNNAAGL